MQSEFSEKERGREREREREREMRERERDSSLVSKKYAKSPIDCPFERPFD